MHPWVRRAKAAVDLRILPCAEMLGGFDPRQTARWRPVRPCGVVTPNHRRQIRIATYFFFDPGAYFLLYTASSDGEQSISGRSVLGCINVKRTLFRATQGLV